MRNTIVKIISFVKNLFSKKNIRIVKIETLLKAKNNLEESKKKDLESIEKLFNKKTKDKSNLIQKLFNLIDQKNLQLVYFKLAQQQANLKTHRDGRSNFAYIYELSNLNTEKEYLENVKKKISSMKLNKEEFEEPNKLLADIVQRIQVITEKLTEFNSTQTIRVQIVPGLNLL